MRPFRVMGFLPQYFASSLNLLSFPRIAQVFDSTRRVIRASSIKRAIFHNFEDYCEQFTELFTILTLFAKSLICKFYMLHQTLTCETTCSNEFPVMMYPLRSLTSYFILIRVVPCLLHFRSFISSLCLWRLNSSLLL